jgi:hypothetical protein
MHASSKRTLSWAIHCIRLVPVVIWLYLTLAHATLAFSLPLIHYVSSSRLQLPAHRHINLLSLSQ